MTRHWFGIVVLFVFVSAVSAIAFVQGYPMVAAGALVCGLVVTSVLAVAWMRPQGSPTEHHPPIDRIFNDLDP